MTGLYFDRIDYTKQELVLLFVCSKSSETKQVLLSPPPKPSVV